MGLLVTAAVPILPDDPLFPLELSYSLTLPLLRPPLGTARSVGHWLSYFSLNKYL